MNECVRILFASMVFLCACCLPADYARADATITVTTTSDSLGGSATSLRDAIMAADFAVPHTGVITIKFDPSVITGLATPIVLTDDMVAINLSAGNSLVVDGRIAGAPLHQDKVWIRSIEGYRPFFIYAGTVAIHDAIISDTIAVGGDGVSGGAGMGGAVFVKNGASVSLADVVFYRNAARGGAGRYVNPNSSGGGGLGGSAGGTCNCQTFDPSVQGASGGGGLGGDGGAGNGRPGKAGFVPNLSVVAGAGGLSDHGSGGLGGSNGGGGGSGSHNYDVGGTYYQPGGGGGGGGVGGSSGGAAIDDDVGSQSGGHAGNGGDGGFGGGGGGGGDAGIDYMGMGGNGGFGGGGGAGIPPWLAGAGGFGGGAGPPGSKPGFGGGVNYGAGAGLGGVVFAMGGSSVTFGGNISQSEAAVAQGIGGSHTFGSAFFLQGSGTLHFDPGFGQAVAIGDTITDASGARVGNDPSSPPYSTTPSPDFNPQSDHWGIAKTGLGVLELRGADTYTGPTAVDADILRVTGSNYTSSTQVASAGTLTGDGSVGIVLVAGTLAPGTNTDPYGMLNVVGTLTLQPGARSCFYADQAGLSSSVASTGVTHINGIARIDFLNSPAAGAQYTLLHASSIVGTFSAIDTNIRGLQGVVNYSPSSVTFTVAANDEIFGDGLENAFADVQCGVAIAP